MSGRTVERKQSIEHALAEEQKALRDIQNIREQQAKERVQDRVLHFEESNGSKTVSYNETLKETVWRDPEDQEYVVIDNISIDEKNELDAMYDTVTEYEAMAPADLLEIEEEKEMDDDFFRDDIEDIDRDDDMEL